MMNKGKKDPKTTIPKTKCGCGCLPVKKWSNKGVEELGVPLVPNPAAKVYCMNT